MAVIFNAGINTQTVALTTLPDQLIEGDEELRATLIVSTNNVDTGRIDITIAEATVTITEDIGMSTCHITQYSSTVYIGIAMVYPH